MGWVEGEGGGVGDSKGEGMYRNGGCDADMLSFVTEFPHESRAGDLFFESEFAACL